jgi:hypothetical protein
MSNERVRPPDEIDDYFGIDRVFLLGEDWNSNADCQPCKGNH